MQEIVKHAYAISKVTSVSVDKAAFYLADAQLLVSETGGGDEKPRRSFGETRLKAAKAVYQAYLKDAQSVESIYEWSNNWRTSAMYQAATDGERITTAKMHLTRMNALRDGIKEAHQAGRISDVDVWMTSYYCADAELIVAEASRAE